MMAPLMTVMMAGWGSGQRPEFRRSLICEANMFFFLAAT